MGRLISSVSPFLLRRSPLLSVLNLPATSKPSFPASLATQSCRLHQSDLKLAPRHFLNLTNGIEALPFMQSLISASELRFIRIQSSQCKASAYEKLLLSLDTELTFSLACGRECFIYDFGSRNKLRGVPRSIFLGIEFLRWSLAYLWFDRDGSGIVPERVLVRGKNAVPFWRDEVMKFRVSRDVKRRLRYYARYAKEMGVRDIRLYGVYGRVSDVDGKKNVHVKMVRDWLQTQTVSTDQDHELAGWMSEHGLAVHVHDADAEDLVKMQEWMQLVTNGKHQNGSGIV